MQIRLGALVDDLVAAMATLVGPDAQVTAGGGVVERPWVATLTSFGQPSGSCLVMFDRAGVAAVGRAMTGAAADVSDSTIADHLRDVMTKGTAASAARPQQERLDLTLSTFTPCEAIPSQADGAVAYTMTAPGMESPLLLAVKWIEAAAETAAQVPDDSIGSRLDVILDIDLPVVVRFGHTEMPIRALSRLAPGSVIDLGRSPDDPVEVLVSNRVVARGEVVIVGGNYGVRILDVTSQSERARSLEA